MRLSKTHVGLASPGGQVSYVLRWTNPCRSPFANVVLEDVVPEPLQIIRLGADAPATISGQTVRWQLGTFDKGPSGLATIDVRLPADLEAGQVLTNTARLYSGTEVLAEASDAFAVRPAELGRLRCALRAQVYARPGTPIRYTVRYKNAGTSNTLTVSLPEAGFSPLAFVPPPDTLAGAVFAYGSLNRTAGLVRIDGIVSPEALEGTVLYSWASIEDNAGHAAVCEHRSVVRTRERLSLFLKGPSKWRVSQTATVLARYSGASTNNELVIVLPAVATLVNAIPAPTQVDNHVYRFANLPLPAGKVRLSLRLNSAAPLPAELTFGATMTDDSGLVAEASATAELVGN